jgi:hypothetical protein
MQGWGSHIKCLGHVCKRVAIEAMFGLKLVLPV